MRKLWRSIINPSGFVAKNKTLTVVILVLIMLPFCGAVRVHRSGPQATRADTRAPYPRGAGWGQHIRSGSARLGDDGQQSAVARGYDTDPSSWL